jgi:hypothetical protein
METKIKYVEQKLTSGLFNIKMLCIATGISHPTIKKIELGQGDKVRPYIIDALYNFFMNVGE